MTGLQPWDRRPSDTVKSWQAFVVYRDLGPDRSLQKVAAELRKSHQLISRWCQRHDWRDRAGAWDGEQDRDHQDLLRRSRHLVQQRHVNLARQLSGMALRGMQSLNPLTLSPSELRQWLDLAVKIERAVYGLDEQAGLTLGGGGIRVLVDPLLIPGPTATPDDPQFAGELAALEGGDDPLGY